MSLSNGRPLAGLTVLDVGTLLAGPMAATLLADFGARVIKVEAPKTGDSLRHMGPTVNGVGLWWSSDGRNKESITVDMRVAEGQEIVRQLAAKADVVIENFRPGTMAGWGLGFDDLVRVNNRIIMLSVSGYGQTGPYSNRAGYDRMAWAFAGLMGITGFPDRPPLRAGVAVVDYQTSLFGAFSILLAVYKRDVLMVPGGQHIDLSLYESAFRFSETLVTAFDKIGLLRERTGNKNSASAPGEHFRTSDGGYVAIGIASDGMFRKLCDAMNKPALATDERFLTHAARWKNIDEINTIVGDWVLSLPVPALVLALDKNGVAYSRIYTAEDILADPHYAARNSIAVVEDPKIGTLKVPAAVPHFIGEPAADIRPAPTLGQHTTNVLRDMLGLEESRIAAMRDKGVI